MVVISKNQEKIVFNLNWVELNRAELNWAEMSELSWTELSQNDLNEMNFKWLKQRIINKNLNLKM